MTRAGAAQDNIEAVCALADDLAMPQLLETADAWLVEAAEQGDLMDVPSLGTLQNTDQLLVQQYDQKLLSDGPSRYRSAQHELQQWLPGWLANKNQIVREAAAVNFARWAALARARPLPRFAEAVKARVCAMSQADQLLLLQAEMRDMRTELKQLRPPPPSVLALN